MISSVKLRETRCIVFNFEVARVRRIINDKPHVNVTLCVIRLIGKSK